MARAQRVVHVGQRMVAFLAMLVFTWAMVGCAKPTAPTALLSEPTEAPHLLAGPMAEVSPPETLDILKQIIDAYTPQVRILSPRPGEVVESATVAVRFQVRGLPLFKDKTWQLGPHLHVFLDDQPYQAVYDASEPLVLEDLAPGTHTLRVFASRPWHESFKNDGAFDQRTFHVFAPTPQNEVNASAPLLTYSRPQGTYGAEPIMLDFYLTNAPLHLSAQEDPKDDLHDWRIRCTVNGQSFVFDQWQPIYLKGFQPGRNWVQLELIDETGRPIENRFNNTVRIIDYQPGGTDTLSRLVRGELDLKAVASIIDPTYTPPASPEPPATEPTPEVIDEAEDIVPADPPETPTPQADASVPEATLNEGSTPATVDLDEPDLETADIEESSLENADLEPSVLEPSVLEPSALEVPQPEDTTGEPPIPALDGDAMPTDEPEVETTDKPTASAPPTEEVTAPTPEVAPTATPPSEAVPTPEPLATDAAQSQGQVFQTQAQSSPAETIAPPSSPMDRGKGMMKRWKTWTQQQTLPGFGSAPPDTTPEPPPVPVYEVPAATATAPDDLGPSSSTEMPPSDSPELPMAMPELVEPYLTQPYMTEPRMDMPSSESDQSPDSTEPEVLDRDQADHYESPSPDTDGSTGFSPMPSKALKRPYI